MKFLNRYKIQIMKKRGDIEGLSKLLIPKNAEEVDQYKAATALKELFEEQREIKALNALLKSFQNSYSNSIVKEILKTITHESVAIAFIRSYGVKKFGSSSEGIRKAIEYINKLSSPMMIASIVCMLDINSSVRRAAIERLQGFSGSYSMDSIVRKLGSYLMNYKMTVEEVCGILIPLGSEKAIRSLTALLRKDIREFDPTGERGVRHVYGRMNAIFEKRIPVMIEIADKVGDRSLLIPVVDVLLGYIKKWRTGSPKDMDYRRYGGEYLLAIGEVAIPRIEMAIVDEKVPFVKLFLGRTCGYIKEGRTSFEGRYYPTES